MLLRSGKENNEADIAVDSKKDIGDSDKNNPEEWWSWRPNSSELVSEEVME